MISEFLINPKNLGHGAPVGGTAIYLTPDPAGWEKTWALWTSIVSTVPGCLGVTGGWMVEPVEGNLSYIVYVGWESVEVHDSYHVQNTSDSDRLSFASMTPGFVSMAMLHLLIRGLVVAQTLNLINNQ